MKMTRFPTYRPAYSATNDIEDVWHKMAVDVLDSNASVSDWLSSQLENAPAFLPPQLMTGEHARKKYKDYTDTAFDDADILLRAQANTYLVWKEQENAVTEDKIEEILTNYRLNFRPEFIWCRAKLCGMEKLAARYEQAAKRRLGLSAIRKAYQKVFPEIDSW